MSNASGHPIHSISSSPPTSSNSIRSLKSKLFSNKLKSLSPSSSPSPSPSSHSPPLPLTHSIDLLKITAPITTTSTPTTTTTPLPNYHHSLQPVIRRNQLSRKPSFSSFNNGPRIIRLPSDSPFALHSLSPLTKDHSLHLFSSHLHPLRPAHPSSAPKLSSHHPLSPNRLPQLASIKPPSLHRPSTSPYPRPAAFQPSPSPSPSPQLPHPYSAPCPSSAQSIPSAVFAPDSPSLSHLVTHSPLLPALIPPPPSAPPPTQSSSTSSEHIDLQQARLIIQGLQNEVSLLKSKPSIVKGTDNQDLGTSQNEVVECQMGGVLQTEPSQGREQQKLVQAIASEKAIKTDPNEFQEPPHLDHKVDNANELPTSYTCEPPKDDLQQKDSLPVLGTTEQVPQSSLTSPGKAELAVGERRKSDVVTPVNPAKKTLASSPSALQSEPEQTSDEKTVMKIEDVEPGLRNLLSPNALTTPLRSPRQLTPRPSRLRPQPDDQVPMSAPVTPARSRLPVPRRRHTPAPELGYARCEPSPVSSGSTEPRLDTPCTPSTDWTTLSPRSPTAVRSPVQLLHHPHGRQLRSAAGRQWQATDWQLDGSGISAGECLATTPGRQRVPHKLAHGLRSPTGARPHGLPATMGHWTSHRPTHSAGLHSLFSHPSVESGGTEAESWFEELGEGTGLGRANEGSVAGSSMSSQAERQLGGLKTMSKLELFLAASKQRARLVSVRSAFAIEREALTEALEACREECGQLRKERDRLVAEDGWKRVELARAREEVGWLSKTVERLELERSRLETRANAMANELKRAVVDLRTVASAGVDGDGSSAGGSRIPVRVGSQKWVGQYGEGMSGHEGSEDGAEKAESHSETSSATGRVDDREGSIWGRQRWESSDESEGQTLEQASMGQEEAESEEEEEYEQEDGTGSSGLSPSSTVFADHDRTRQSMLVQMCNRNGSTGIVSSSSAQRGYGWRERERARSSVVSMEMLRPEDELFLENLVFGDGEEEGSDDGCGENDEELR